MVKFVTPLMVGKVGHKPLGRFPPSHWGNGIVIVKKKKGISLRTIFHKNRHRVNFPENRQKVALIGNCHKVDFIANHNKVNFMENGQKVNFMGNGHKIDSL
jgi:hypothetical protein